MKLEEALKTKGFTSQAQKAHLNILFTASLFRRKMKNYFVGFGITMEQYNVLRIVRGAKGKPIMVKEISERMIEQNSNTTRIIDKLESKGLIGRVKLKSDGRVRTIVMTDDGTALMARVDETFLTNDPHATEVDEAKYEKFNLLLEEIWNEVLDKEGK